MELAYILSGAAPIIKRFQVSATVANVGVPLLIPGAGNAGLPLGTTTSAANLVGVNLDASGTYQTAQQSDNSDPERTVAVIINPDAVWRARLSGGATEGTALALQAVSSAATDGLAVTTGAEWSNPTFDEGYVWGYDGSNAGIARKITSVSGTAGTVTVAFPFDTAVGDNFLRAPFTPMQTVTAQLTTLLTEVDASIAVGTGGAWIPVELVLKDQTDNGRTNSFVLLLSGDHQMSARPT
jgi:hypothetical protein